MARHRVLWDAEARSRQAAMMRARWADPEWRAKATAAITACNQSPERRKQNSELRSRYYADDAARKRQSEIMRKAKWCIPIGHFGYYRKLLGCGIPRDIARAEVDRIAAESKAP